DLLRDLTSVGRSKQKGARLIAVVSAIACVACGGSLPYVWVQDVPPEPETVAEAPIQAGDTITVFVQEQEGLSGDFLVGADGAYIQPIVGSVHVAGRTPAQVEEVLRGRLRGILAEPVVGVSVAQRRPIRVGVLGEVNQPGHF